MIREIPDLLYKQTRMLMESETLQTALNDAFFLGKPQRALENALKLTDLGDAWDPELFSNDLFLKELIETCFLFKIKGVPCDVNRDALLFLLSHPPTDLETIRFRQSIMRDMENPETLEDVKRVYASLQWMIHYLNGSLQGSYTSYSDVTSWRMTVLRQIKQVIDLMPDSFSGTSEGLSRLRRAGLELRGSEKYQQLSGLVDYDDNMLGLKLNLRVGASGDLRDFKILHVKENTGNLHYSPPARRFYDKIMLWLRGFKFSNVQLVSTLIEHVYKDLEDWLALFLQISGHLEFYLAGLAFREKAMAAGLAVCLPEFNEDNTRVQMGNLFNPLLFQQETSPVPTAVASGYGTTTLITGPNSGGKTRLLQALGIAQILGQSGLYAPVASAKMHVMNGMFVSLIEEGKVDQKEGRLGMELIRIRTLFEKSNPRCMILLDELCSGTNPSEGIEILDLVLKLIPKLTANAFISTHFLEYARTLEQDRPISNLEFIRVDLSKEEAPTYRFIPGVATTSLARNTARRLGVTLDELSGLIDIRNAASAVKSAGFVSSLSKAPEPKVKISPTSSVQCELSEQTNPTTPKPQGQIYA